MPRLKPSYWDSTHVQGVTAALLSAVVLGLAPIFGKQAMLANVPWQSVVMLRTVIAVATLWIAYALHKAWRPYFYIYPVGFVGCMLAGLINGLGSLMMALSTKGAGDMSAEDIANVVAITALQAIARRQSHAATSHPTT